MVVGGKKLCNHCKSDKHLWRDCPERKKAEGEKKADPGTGDGSEKQKLSCSYCGKSNRHTVNNCFFKYPEKALRRSRGGSRR